MYALKLILKYLLKRRIAWVSLIAVTLCTAMVLIVISVMGGWLRMFRESAQGLSGDVVISQRLFSGFAYYDEIIERVEQLPGVEAGGAVPIIKGVGLANLANADHALVQVYGLQLDKIGAVNKFPHSLHRQYQQYIDMADDPSLDLTPEQRSALRLRAEQAAESASFDLPLTAEEYRQAVLDRNPSARDAVVENAPNRPGLIGGIGVLHIRKNMEGEFEGREDFLYRLPITLSVVEIPARGAIDLQNRVATKDFWVVDDSRTKVWQYDNNTVYIDFAELQQMLGMRPDPLVMEDGSIREIPPRTSEIHIKAKAGVELTALRDQVQAIVQEVFDAKGMIVSAMPDVQTWEEQQAYLIGPIEREKLLVTILFGIISIVAIFLIFCIFYMIVMEKTRDIGIIKAVGATGKGVAGIFVGYGLVIGLIGAGMGLLAAYLIVHNINELHEWLARQTGQPIWDPRVYQFDSIPNTMVTGEVVVICSVAVLSSVIGALVPAISAARMHPIEALRYE